jgi:hypothetical protein
MQFIYQQAKTSFSLENEQAHCAIAARFRSDSAIFARLSILLFLIVMLILKD